MSEKSFNTLRFIALGRLNFSFQIKKEYLIPTQKSKANWMVPSILPENWVLVSKNCVKVKNERFSLGFTVGKGQKISSMQQICYTCFLEFGLFIIRIRLCIIDGNGLFIRRKRVPKFSAPFFVFDTFFVINIPIFPRLFIIKTLIINGWLPKLL